LLGTDAPNGMKVPGEMPQVDSGVSLREKTLKGAKPQEGTASGSRRMAERLRENRIRGLSRHNVSRERRTQ